MVGSKGRVICIIMTENQHNIVKQLFSNLKIKLKRELKMIYIKKEILKKKKVQMQSDIASHGLPSDFLSKNFSLDPNLFFTAGQSSLLRELTFPNLSVCPWLFFSASGEVRLPALVALSKLGNGGRSQRLQACGCWAPQSHVPVQWLKLSRA